MLLNSIQKSRRDYANKFTNRHLKCRISNFIEDNKVVQKINEIYRRYRKKKYKNKFVKGFTRK